LYLYFVLSCVKRGLCDELSLVQRSPTTCLIRLEKPQRGVFGRIQARAPEGEKLSTCSTRIQRHA
jgi:hypothetical protein